MDEIEELEEYEEDMKWLEEANKDKASWLTRVQREAKTDQQLKRMHLFLIRFTTTLQVPVTCSGCGEVWPIGVEHLCCLDCPNVNLCRACFKSGSQPESHSPETHNVLVLRFRCSGCHCYIVGTRYHCDVCENFDLCAGCHSLGKFPRDSESRHNPFHKVTKFPLLTGTITVEEQQELQQYKEDLKWLMEAKQDFETWHDSMKNDIVTTYQCRRNSMFISRFGHIFATVESCLSCGIPLWKGMSRYTCLICLDGYTICNFCYEYGAEPLPDQEPSGHSESHEVVKLSVWCDGCDGAIVGARYHCNECEDFDLCTGCHTSGKFSERHSSSHKMTKFLMEKGTKKNMEERQELQQYRKNMTWLMEAKRDFPAWFNSTLIEAETHQEKRRGYLFLAQFSNVLDVIIQCQGCGVTLPRGKRLRCLNCLDVNLCFKCHKREVEPEGHSETHDVIRMRFCCNECGSYIVGTRYHCNECEDFDLCAGCHAAGNFPGRHSATHEEHEEVSHPLKKGNKVAAMSNRKQAVLDHNIAFFVSFYLFMTKRFSEAIKIFKESLLLVNHKALRNEIEFVSIVKLLAYSLMCHGYMLLEDTWNFSKVWLHLIIVVPGCTLKTILKPHGLEEFYKRQCKYEEAHALWMEAGEKEEEDQDEMFPAFLDEISPGEYKMTAAIVHEMSTSRKECFSGKIFCRQLSSSFVKIRKFFKEALSIVEVFDKEKPVPPHYERFSEIIHFYDESIKHLKQETLSLEKKNGSGAKAASVHELRVLGKTWVFSGDYFKAKENFEEALAISIEQGDKKEEATCYGMLGAVFQGLQRYDEAKKNLDKQLAIYKEIGDIHGQARSYENLGTLYTFLVDTVKAEEYFRKALEIAKKTGHRDIETSCCKKLGDLFAALGKPVRAKKFSDKALVLSKEMENYHALALGMKPFNKAAARLLNSMHGLDVDTRGCQDEMRALFSDQAFLGHKILSFMFCCLGNPHTGLCSAELARARALADFLSAQYSVEMKRSVDYFNPQKRIGMERILKTERNCCCLYISYFSQFITVWLLKADHPLLFRRIEVSDFCAKLLRSDIDASCRKIYRKEHHLTPEQDKDQSLFPSQSFQEGNLPFSRLIEEDDDEEDQGTSLTPADYYNITIAPVVDFLDEPEIVIVPDRVFFRLPFAALKDKSGPYLSETFRIRIVPSLTILKMIQDSPADYHSQTGALIVGDPDVGRVLYKGNFRRIGRLSEASKEAEMIGRLLDVQPLLGKQATKEKILQSINSVSLVHFAAHGDDERGEIFLAPPPMRNRTPQEEDYLLTMAEISRVRVRAKLVVLSCCHSANGKIRQEGVVGIGRAFLASGARSVLVALWAIEDKATYQLMIRFYEHLVRGESASESLHQAMKWMRENGYSKVGQWAPFMLIGDNVSFDFQRIRPASHETQPY